MQHTAGTLSVSPVSFLKFVNGDSQVYEHLFSNL